MPPKPDILRTAHSLTEAYLFLTAMPCPVCGKGPLRAQEPEPSQPLEMGASRAVEAECVACGDVTSWSFRLAASAKAGTINPTAEPSRILDVAQWIMLSGMIAATASTETDREQKRRLLIEAAQCLDEALKFYADGNDLPPFEAFFHEGSRLRLRQTPGHFSRQRLLHLRSKLPHASAVE